MPDKIRPPFCSIPPFASLCRSRIPRTLLPRSSFLRRGRALLALAALAALPPVRAEDQKVTFNIPAVKIPLKIKEQNATIAASARITLLTKKQGLNILNLQLTADLSGLQENLTALLSSTLDKNDPCGDRIALQHATLAPLDPGSLAVVQLHYERWACAKVLGKKESRRLVGGNAVLEMKLTPAIEDATGLRLVPEVGTIEADGSLGELLRSGALGELLREKIRDAILSALEKGTDLSATLPPAVQGYAKISSAEFKDGGSGRLLAVLSGEIQLTSEQLRELSSQVKERTKAH